MPSTTECPHCGAALKPRVIELMGRSIQAGYEECGCAAAVAERDERDRAEAEAEAERRRGEAARRVREAGVVPRFEKAWHPLAAECAEAMEAGRNLYVFGDVGTTKTQLASAVARLLAESGRDVQMTSMRRVLAEVRQGFDGGGDPLPSYARRKFLILDDLGKESPTDFALERMFALVDERYGMMLPTAVTTQYAPGRLVERLAKNGDADTAKAIVSRLRQGCKKVELTGADRRLA